MIIITYKHIRLHYSHKRIRILNILLCRLIDKEFFEGSLSLSAFIKIASSRRGTYCVARYVIVKHSAPPRAHHIPTSNIKDVNQPVFFYLAVDPLGTLVFFFFSFRLFMCAIVQCTSPYIICKDSLCTENKNEYLKENENWF